MWSLYRSIDGGRRIHAGRGSEIHQQSDQIVVGSSGEVGNVRFPVATVVNDETAMPFRAKEQKDWRPDDLVKGTASRVAMSA